MAEHLQAVIDGDIKRLLINLPPRLGKSSICSVALPAWCWAQPISGPTSGPSVQFLHASYAEKLSLRDSVKCRRLIESPWYQKHWGERFNLLGDQNTKSRFGNDRGGERLITSIGGAATGEGMQIGVVDDPNAANEAFSEANIEATLEWWDGTMSTRLNDQKTGAFIVIQQRLAENDLSGHILEHDIGEWTHLCYDSETEILTNTGWVRFPELADDAVVLGVHPETLRAKWEKVTGVVREPYRGEMIHYKSMTADLMVTPDHRMIYGDMNDWTRGKPSRWRVRSANDLPSEFYLPQVVRPSAGAKTVEFAGQTWGSRAFAEFMGWYLSEGCANAGRRVTRIVQNKEGRHVGDIERVLAAIPFHVGRSEDRPGRWCWQIKNRFLARALEPLGKSKNKRAPPEMKKLGAEDLQAFIICYAKGDGHFAVRNGLKMTISTTSPRMADDIQECAVRAGWASSLNIRHEPAGTMFNGYPRPACTHHRVYIRASKSPGRERKVGSRIRPCNTSRVPYDGTVYCVSVPSTAVVVRRGGRVSVSGNCLPMRYEPDRSYVTSIGWKDPRTEPSELLWPERFGDEEVRALERSLASRAPGQLQQRPEPAGGGVIKRDWWQLWDETAFPPMDFILASLDTAYTMKTENDFSALTIWGVFSTDPAAVAGRSIGPDGRPIYIDRVFTEQAPKVMLMNAWQERLELHELVQKVATTCKRLKVDCLIIENKAAGHSVAQEMRRLYSGEGFAVQLHDPKSQDKLSRLYSVQHLFAEGMVYAPDRPWAEMVMTQVGQFPKGTHDDLCLVADTQIATRNGPRPIQDVRAGDQVLTPLGFRKVLASSPTGRRQVVRRSSINGTGNHPVMDLDLGWQRLDTVTQASRLSRLRLCDLIRTIRQSQSSSTEFAIGSWADRENITCRNLGRMPEGVAPKASTLRFGSIMPVGPFRRAMRSITETVTPSIAALKILSAYRLACIGACLSGSIAKGFALTSPKSDRSPASGTGLRKGERGIGRTLSTACGKLERRRGLLRPKPAAPASGAVEVLSTETAERCFAQPPARPPSPDMNAGKAVESPLITQLVYNLTVEDAHCYYANGVLVHNCDTVSQALRHLRDRGLLIRGPERLQEIEAMRQYEGRPPTPLYPA